MPLTFADADKEYIIRSIGGTSEIRQHLADMGFAVDSPVKVVSSIEGDIIVAVKGVRFGISRELASKIMV